MPIQVLQMRRYWGFRLMLLIRFQPFQPSISSDTVWTKNFNSKSSAMKMGYNIPLLRFDPANPSGGDFQPFPYTCCR